MPELCGQIEFLKRFLSVVFYDGMVRKLSKRRGAGLTNSRKSRKSRPFKRLVLIILLTP